MKKCPPGEYYCNQDKKCKSIPSGYHTARGGFLVRDDYKRKMVNTNYQGGHIEMGESAINGAKREVKEETGLDVTNLKKIASNNIRFLFKGKINTNNVTISDEHKGYKFILQKDIFKLPLSKWSKNDLKFLKQKEKHQIEEND